MNLSRRRLLLSGAATAAVAGGSIGASSTFARPAPAAKGLTALRNDLRGRLLLPGDPGYSYAAWPNNARWADIRPMAIALCADDADVKACIDWVRQEDQIFAVRSGGHNYAGFSTTEGLLIDVKPMSSVTVDTKNGLAIVSGGVNNQGMADALRGTGMAVPSGRCPTVGASGLVLGGGWGFAATRSGLTCDALRSTDVVTADGVKRRASDAPGEENDLFWAARGGGGGNFGVHTAFTFALKEVGEVTTFNIVWPGKLQVELMAALQAIQLENARSISTRTKIAPGRGGTPTRQDLKVQTLGLFWGPPSDLRQALAPAFSLLQPEISEINAMNYWSARDYLVTDDPTGLYDLRSSYVKGALSGDAVETMLRWMERWPGGSVRQDNMGILFAIGGAVKDKKPTDTAYVHRDADFIFEMEAMWSPLDTYDMIARQQAWLTSYFDAMQQFVMPHSYVNFPSRDLPHWKHAYYGQNLSRLSAVKRQYDPDNIFRFAQSIPLSEP